MTDMTPQEELELFNEVQAGGLSLTKEEMNRREELEIQLAPQEAGLVEDLDIAPSRTPRRGMEPLKGELRRSKLSSPPSDITLRRTPEGVVDDPTFGDPISNPLESLLGGLLGPAPKDAPLTATEIQEQNRSFTALAVELGIEAIGIVGGAKGGKEIGEKALQKALPGTGATAGQFLGDQAVQGLQRVDALKPLLGEPPGEFLSPESLQQSGEDAAFIGGANVVGAGVSRVAKAVSGMRAIKNMTPEDREMARFLLDQFEKDPSFRINPSLLNPESKLFALADNIREFAFTTGSDVIRTAKNIQASVTNAMRARALKLTEGRDRAQIFRQISDTAKGRLTEYNATLEATAHRINLLNTSPIQISSPVKFIQSAFATSTGLKIPKEAKIASKLRSLVDEKNFISLGESQAVINDLAVEVQRLQKSGADDLLLNKLKSLRTKMVNQQAQQVKNAGDPALANDIRLFNRVQLDGPAKFNRDLLREIVKLDPETAGSLYKIIKSPQKLRSIKATVSTKEWNKIQGATMQDVMKSSQIINEQTGDIFVSGAEMIRHLNNIPDNIKKTMFHPVALKNFEKFARFLTRAQAERVATGKIFVQMAQAGIITGLLFGDTREASIVLMFFPTAIDFMFKSQRVTESLLKTASISPTASTGTKRAIISSFIGLLTKEGIDFQQKSREEFLDDPFDILDNKAVR